jgi:hypothetical protein
LEVLTSAELDPKSDPIAAASRRGAVAATLLISKRLPPRFPSLPDGLIGLCLRGPEGLTLTPDVPAQGKIDGLRLPAHFAAPAGIEMRFNLSGPPVAAEGSIHVLLTLPPAQPPNADLPGKTELQISFSKADLDAAIAGKTVTCALYLAREGKEGSAPRLQMLSSAQMESGKDPVAEAAEHGTVLAILKLSKDLADLPLREIGRVRAIGFAAEPPAEGALAPVEALREKQLIALCLSGPKGLTLTPDVPGLGKIDGVPLPAHLAVSAGIELRFTLSGPPTAEKDSVYALLTLPPAQPPNADLPGKTELPITFTNADLDAALAGKTVTCVLYLASEAQEGSAPRLQVLSSAQMESGKDPVAEAAEHGTVLAILKLSKDPADLPPPANRAAPARGEK